MTNYNKKLDISKEEREVLITKLVDELPVLRTKLGASQADLAALIDISRQTYSLIETKKRKLSWSIFLSLILVFDNNVQTHDLIRKQKLFQHMRSFIVGVHKASSKSGCTGGRPSKASFLVTR